MYVASVMQMIFWYSDNIVVRFNQSSSMKLNLE